MGKTSGTVTSGYASLHVASGSPMPGCNGDDTPQFEWGPLFRNGSACPKPGHTPASCSVHSSPVSKTGIADGQRFVAGCPGHDHSVRTPAATKVAQATTLH